MKAIRKSALIGSVVILAAVGAWLVYAAQCAYTPRAKLSEGLNLAAGVKTAVAEYYVANRRFPVDNAETGLSDPITSRFVSDVTVLPGGRIQLTYGGFDPDPVIAGKTLDLQAIVDAGSGDISWTCTIEELEARHIPAQCR